MDTISLENRYDTVYRQKGVRFIAKLDNPNPYPISELDEIHLATLHYYNPFSEKSSFGISPTHPMIVNAKKKQLSYHVQDIPHIKGPYRKRIFNYRLGVKAYHRHNRSIVFCKDEKKLQLFDNKRPWNIIIDYSLMGRTIEFKYHVEKHINVWNSRYGAYLFHANRLMKNSNRHQIMSFTIPSVIPTIPQLRLAEKELKRNYYKIFPTDTELSLLDFWIWLDPNNRSKSLMGKYLDERNYPRIDFLFMHNGYFVLLNLGLLNRWVTGEEVYEDDNEVDDDEDGDEGLSQSTVNRFRKRFYKFLNKFISKTSFAPPQSSLTDIENKEEEEAKVIQKIYDTSSEDKLDKEILDADKADALPEDADLSKVEVEDSNPSVVPSKEEPIKKEHEVTEPPPTSDVNSITSGFVEMPDTNRNKIIVSPDGKSSTQSNQQKLFSESIFDSVRKVVKDEVDIVGMTPAEEKHWNKVSEKITTLKSPYSDPEFKNKNLVEIIDTDVDMTISEESSALSDIPMVTDKRLLKATTRHFHRDYIRKGLKRDVLRCSTSLQKSGINIVDYNVETKKDVASEFEIHSLTVIPVGGSQSTIKLKLPKIDEEGILKSGSVRYRLRNQRRDAPIRKVSENKASLTSYYGKLFFNRSDLSKYNFDRWMTAQMDIAILDGEISEVTYGKITTNIKQLPQEVASLIKTVKSFKVSASGVVFDFSQLSYDDKTGIVTLGSRLSYDSKNKTYLLDKKPVDKNALFGINFNKAPAVHAEMHIFGQRFPLGIVMARQIGFANLIKTMGLEPDKYEPNKRIENADEFIVVRFMDEKWAFKRSHLTYQQTLILNGFIAYEKYIKQYSIFEFDAKDVYGAIFHEQGLQRRFEIEMDLMEDMFVDPITRDILIQMNEPTDMIGLYFRIVDLLVTSDAKDEINMDDMLIKGYDRVAGNVYTTIIQGLRKFKQKPITAKRRFEIGPEDAWLSLASDPTMEIVNDINPWHNAKEKTNVTYSGNGGRDSQTMNTAKTRIYGDSDTGVISEASVDSSDIGFTTFMSANAQLANSYGMIKKDKEVDAASLYSVPVLTCPFASADDGKRSLFSGTQASHRIPILGGMPSPIRTGYENVIIHGVDKKFGFVSEASGFIKEVTDKYMTVVYNHNQKEETYQLGVRIASGAGAHYYHHLVCDLPKGYKFKKDEVLAYNTAFFTRDLLNMTQVIPVDKVIVSTALMETNDTLEDGSAVSTEMGMFIDSVAVKEKLIVVNASDELLEMVKVGDKVDVDTPLTIINDATINQAGYSKFDKDSLDILRRLSRVSPKAGVSGKVTKLECFYFCEEHELSASIQKVIDDINQSNFSGTKTKLSDRRDMNGRITEPLKFGGDFIGPGKVGIRVYMHYNTGTRPGDKVVFANQLKSVIGRVWQDDHKMESGKLIHAMFGYTSISNRIVASAEMMGLLNLLLKEVTVKALEAYDNN